MPVGDIPELSYVKLCVLAALSDISTSKKAKANQASAYYTDLATVGEPDYRYDDVGRIMQEKAPAALVWTFGIRSDEKGTSHERRPIVRVLVIGFVQQPLNVNRSGPRFESDVQRKGERLWDDIDRTMLGNPMQTHPQANGAVNTYGVFTANVDNAPWEPQQPVALMGSLIIPCFYDITFRSPF